MIGNRVDDASAAAFAAQHGWTATSVAYSGEAKPVKQGAETGVSPKSAAEIGSAALGAARRCRTSTQFDVRRCGQDGAEVRGRTVGGRTRARSGNRRASARRAPAVGQRGGAATRESGRPLGGVADEPSGAAVDVRCDRHAGGQCVCGARRFRARHARHVRNRRVGCRTVRGTGARDQSLRSTRPLQRDP